MSGLRLRQALLSLTLLLAFLTGCGAAADSPGSTTPAPSTIISTATPSPSHTPTPPPTAIPSTTATPFATPTGTPTAEPSGCREPPDDYSLVQVSGFLLNRRTEVMLEHAAELYGGEIDLVGYALTQGSYTDSVSASFGTHAGGGAIDLSVMRSGTYTVLYDEIEAVILALRTAGFAAWLRDFDEVETGSPIHIHAVAIGDEHLSPAAQDQLTGEFGYFRGYNGLPQNGLEPQPDRHHGPIICQWMLDAGYADLQPTPAGPPAESSTNEDGINE